MTEPTIEQRIAEKLHAALTEFEQLGISVPGGQRGMGTGASGQAIIRLSVEDVASIAAGVVHEMESK